MIGTLDVLWFLLIVYRIVFPTKKYKLKNINAIIEVNMDTGTKRSLEQ